MFASFFLKFLVTVIIIVLLIGIGRTWYIKNDSRQQIFVQGSVPDPLPNGFYYGTLSGESTTWLGKEFNKENDRGVNIFNDGFESRNKRYHFRTWIGRGLSDKGINVMKLDYNVSGNPFWLKLILEEIVQVAPGEFLGKMQIKIIPGYPFSILYFELKKNKDNNESKIFSFYRQ